MFLLLQSQASSCLVDEKKLYKIELDLFIGMLIILKNICMAGGKYDA